MAINSGLWDTRDSWENPLSEYIDFASGKERYNSDAAYLEVLRAYHLHTPQMLEKLRALSPKSMWISSESASGNGRTETGLSEYTLLAHSLKGSSYSIGANAIGKTAADLESAARAGNTGRIWEGTGPFVEQVERLLAALGELLQQAAAGRKREKAAAPDRGLLEQLLDAAASYRSSAVEEIIAGLESREYETGGEMVVWLREMADNLEYDAIRERLERDTGIC
jgi:HPt (histidine-containing phosphotransfer) domain-containing protein